MNVHKLAKDERGVALPMAIMMLVLLTGLMVSFAMLARTEPTIAANQLRVAQARGLAESGIERAVWALTNYSDAQGLPAILPLVTPNDNTSTATAPFNGATFMSGGSLTSGGFTVAIRKDQSVPADQNIREITAVGWTPTNDGANALTKAHRRLFVKVKVVPDLASQAPCALCVKGALQAQGNATVNGTNTDPACGGNNKYGAFSANAASLGNNTNFSGGAGGYAENQGDAAFEGFSYGPSSLDALKALAKKNGTYYGPGFPNGGFTNDGSTSWSGSIAFNSSNQLSNGIVFVDTTDGVNLDPAATNTATMASMTIHGLPFTGLPKAGSTLPNVPISTSPPLAFRGMIVSNGSLGISGGMTLQGLVYAVNDFSYNGTGAGGLYGQVITNNMRDTSSTSVDSSTTGNSRVVFNCSYAKAFNMIPFTFSMIPGSYRELTD
jgi:Tfp pilus assembly protein PilX